MVNYTCKRCGYNTSIKTHLLNHYGRKKPCNNLLGGPSIEECIQDFCNEKNIKFKKCVQMRSNALAPTHSSEKTYKSALEMRSNAFKCVGNAFKCVEEPINGYFCNNCGKNFKLQRYLVQHQKRYKCYNNNSNDDLHDLSTKLTEIKEELKKDIDKEYRAKLDSKDEMIEFLRSEISVLLKEKGNTYTTNNLVIQPFGKENTKYIKREYIDKLLSIAPIKCIPNLLEYIHFNPEHVENQNVKIPNKKDSFAKVYDGTKWEYKDKHETIENMTDKAYGIINKHYDQGANKYIDSITEKVAVKDKDIMKKIQKDTEVMILNKQSK
jgi:hypothetical protein